MRYGLKVPMIPVYFLDYLAQGIGTSYDMSYYRREDRTQGDDQRIGAMLQHNLVLDRIELQFNASYRRCIMVQAQDFTVEGGNPYQKSFDFTFQKKNPVGSPRYAHICLGNIEKGSIKESWYFVGERTLAANLSPLVDQWGDQRQIAKLMRGVENYNDFMNMINEEQTLVFLNQDSSRNDLGTYLDRFYYKRSSDGRPEIRDSAIPGVVSPNINYPKK